MTESATAGVYRPSPRPRPAGAPSRPDSPHLHVVRPKSELPTSGTGGEAPADSISAGQHGPAAVSDTAVSEIGFRVRAAGLWQASKTYWTPPAVFTDRPASLAELADYASLAPWTSQNTGLARGFGVWYHRVFGYPYTVVSRYREWFVQRPLRFAALVGGVKLASMTGPGAWVVDTIVYPAARTVGHILL